MNKQEQGEGAQLTLRKEGAGQGESVASGPVYYADGNSVFKSPVKTSKPNGGCSITIGFPVCTAHECVTDGAKVIAAKLNQSEVVDELTEALQGTLKLLRKAQDVLTMYLHPDSYDADHAVNLLLELLDGPEQRAIETPARAAILKATSVSQEPASPTAVGEV